MKISLPDIRSILAVPAIYRLFTNIVGGKTRSLFVEKYIRPRSSDRVLDIGCGSADILSYLPRVKYVGFDMSKAYINSAKKRFGNRGKFFTKTINKDGISGISLFDFDIVLATGVLHHLNDDEAMQVLELARATLKPGGRLITLDGCYVKGQSWLAQFILSKDRGRYVRNRDEYIGLAAKLFTDIRISIHHDLIRIPYTHIIMECTA